MENNKRIVVAGHICLDVTPILPREYHVGENFYISDKLVTLEGVDVSTGGAVANTGIAMHLLGADVMLMGKIGNDDFGRLILEHLERYRVKGCKDMIVVPNAQTSCSVVLSSENSEVTFMHFPGANDTYNTNDIDYSRIRDAALFHFGYPTIMRRMYEKDGDELVRLFQDVKALGVATSMDMASYVDGVGGGTADWDRILRRTLPYVDFFFASAEELCHMLDPKLYKEWQERANGDEVTKYIDPETEVKPLAERAISYHAKVVVVKCGCKGIYYMTTDYHHLADIGANASINLSNWADKQEWIRPYEPAVIRTTTGAGDVAIAAFLVAALEGMSIRDCARLAAAEGASCLEGYDALDALRTLSELQKMYLMGL